MARLRRVLGWVVAVLAVLAVLAAGVGVWTVRRSFPQVDGELVLPGLAAPVTVHRDAWGVPHLYGSSMQDLVLAQGYVHAQDRFWEMDVRRHVTAGRLAELFGESQLETDRFLRTLGWRRVAEQELALLSEQTRTLLEAYADGVNAHLEDRAGAALSLEYAVLGLTNGGYEPEPWEPADSLAWLKAMAWDLRADMEDEVARARLTSLHPVERIEELYPPVPDDHPPILEAAELADPVVAAAGLGVQRPGGSGLGSNSWVVGPEHTATGGALLANDPHLPASQPGIWHQVGLHCAPSGAACPLDVVGFSLSSVPGIVIGHNDRIAWGFTNLASDVTDLYVEEVDGDRYRFEGAWRDLEVRTEVLEVAGGEPVEIEVRSTHHGPLLSDASARFRELLDIADLPDPAFDGVDVSSATHAVALQWTALTPGTTADAIFELNVAEDFDDFRAAAALFEVPAQNLLYADVEGHVGYQSPGRHPVRAAGHDGRYPVPGWTGAHEWQGMRPVASLPWTLDPADGWIQTANQPVVADDVPVGFRGGFAAGFRGDRIDELLTDLVAAGGITVEDLTTLQFDNFNGALPILGGALRDVPVEGTAAEALALLDDWDGQDDADSAAAAVFNACLRHVLQRTFADDLPEGVTAYGNGRWWLVLEDVLADPDASWWDDRTTPAVERRGDVLAAAVVDAVAELEDLLGGDPADWRWGDLHTLELEHGTLGTSGVAPVEALFNRGPVPTSGGSAVVNATSWSADLGYEVVATPSMRMVVDLDDLDRSRWINLTGVSGHAFHPHYVDQVEAWRTGGTIPMLAGRPAVEAAAVSTLTLRP